MARLHNRPDSDESLPEVDAPLSRPKLPRSKQSKVGNLNKQETVKSHRTKERRKASRKDQSWVQLASRDEGNIERNVSPDKPRSRLQRPSARINGNPLLRPLSGLNLNKTTDKTGGYEDQHSLTKTDPIDQRHSSALPETLERVGTTKIKHTSASDEPRDFHNETNAYYWEYYDDSLSDFIVSDSASESELRLPPRSQRKGSLGVLRRKNRRERRQVLSSDEEMAFEDEEQHSSMKRSGKSQEDILSTLRKLSLGSSEGTEQQAQLDTGPNQSLNTRTHTLDELLPLPKDEHIECSPPTGLCPPKRTKDFRIATSPTLDTSTHLPLLMKPSTTMPLSPHQLCLVHDSPVQEVINRKDQDFSSSLLTDLCHSPLVHRIPDVDDIVQVPPLKPFCTMPARKQQLAARAAKGAFDAEKDDIARSFLSELDMEITGGRLAQLCAHMGGIKIIWSTTLQTTAGRAICTVRQHRADRNDPPTVENSLNIASISSPTKHSTFKLNAGIAYIYHPSKAPANAAKDLLPPADPIMRLSHVTEAKIVLSVKVLTSKERLLKTLSHEFCHLATMALSGEFKFPHGPIWKAWAAKVVSVFGASKGIEISRTHSYDVENRYVWICLKCGHEYKRYNKTIKPETQRCGKLHCHGHLEQIKPKPRGGKGREGAKALGPYQAFVKANFDIVKREHPEWPFGQISAELGQRYQIEKQLWNGVGGWVANKENHQGSKTQPIEIG